MKQVMIDGIVVDVNLTLDCPVSRLNMKKEYFCSHPGKAKPECRKIYNDDFPKDCPLQDSDQ